MGWKSVAVDILPPVVTRGLKRLRGPSGAVEKSEPALWPFSSQSLGSFSQYGEDLVIDAVLGCPTTGIFVDIGANDPVTLNNTKRFSLRGWTGINVEPNPVLFGRLAADCPADVNVCAGVGSSAGELPFFLVDPDTLSSFDEHTAHQNLLDYPGSEIIETIPVPIVSLDKLFGDNLESGTRIDFLSVDVEGLEIEVLSSNDWDAWRPYLLLVEANRYEGPVIQYLRAADYEFAWFNGTNGLFVDTRAGKLA